MIIRAATPDDLPFIDALRPRFLVHGPSRWERDRVLARMQEWGAAAIAAARRDEYFAVAEISSKPSGFIYAETRHDVLMNTKYAYVLELVAERDGRGVGRALLESAEAWARAAGLERISLSVFAANPARDFYTHVGYEVESHRLEKWF